MGSRIASRASGDSPVEVKWVLGSCEHGAICAPATPRRRGSLKYIEVNWASSPPWEFIMCHNFKGWKAADVVALSPQEATATHKIDPCWQAGPHGIVLQFAGELLPLQSVAAKHGFRGLTCPEMTDLAKQVKAIGGSIGCFRK